jgi:hypothetical protein
MAPSSQELEPPENPAILSSRRIAELTCSRDEPSSCGSGGGSAPVPRRLPRSCRCTRLDSIPIAAAKPTGKREPAPRRRAIPCRAPVGLPMDRTDAPRIEPGDIETLAVEVAKWFRMVAFYLLVLRDSPNIGHQQSPALKDAKALLRTLAREEEVVSKTIDLMLSGTPNRMWLNRYEDLQGALRTAGHHGVGGRACRGAGAHRTAIHVRLR